jgi:hypothetical protein
MSFYCETLRFEVPDCCTRNPKIFWSALFLFIYSQANAYHLMEFVRSFPDEISGEALVFTG